MEQNSENESDLIFSVYIAKYIELEKHIISYHLPGVYIPKITGSYIVSDHDQHMNALNL